MNFHIREATIGDARGIARVQVTTWQHHYRGIIDGGYLDSLSVIERSSKWEKIISERARGMVLVAQAEDAIVGFCHFSTTSSDESEGTGEITSIYVDTMYQGRGIGTKLISTASSRLQAQGCNTIVLWVLRGNVSSIQFYESLGWKKDGKTKQVTRGENIILDEIRMTKSVVI